MVIELQKNVEQRNAFDLVMLNSTEFAKDAKGQIGGGASKEGVKNENEIKESLKLNELNGELKKLRDGLRNILGKKDQVKELTDKDFAGIDQLMDADAKVVTEKGAFAFAEVKDLMQRVRNNWMSDQNPFMGHRVLDENGQIKNDENWKPMPDEFVVKLFESFIAMSNVTLNPETGKISSMGLKTPEIK